ncbi:hypothetical protein CPT_Moonbeam191 [Bacillus phage Moonbeam]|uniref:Uncharacterized protein n=1 Tax=Bacillus phage Moonbeam TaxID=1540091 RepID=A0A0A0RPP5_9CAUD|nr:hypothetical protein CPT_Moonbeam191 [Bacillus phage Moonbeam]AIW03589.1 hypothetical protein CPT_Moonbeam191 [Bacillus phage Moonbeam]
MDSVQKFISENSHQFGYIMQEASRQWVAKDPIGALTVGTCKSFIDSYGDYHTILDKLQAIEEAKVPKKDVYKAVISGHIFEEPEFGNSIEIFTFVNNDVKNTDIFTDVEYELIEELKHNLKYKESHFFTAIVYARWSSWQSQEGTEYDVEYDIHEIKQISDLDKGADF